jgi:addiction module HigA family antidote
VIADIIDTNRVSLRAAARAIGMSAPGLEKVLKGRGPVTAGTAARLEAWFGNEGGAVLWLTMQRDYDLWHARQALRAELAAIVPLAGTPRRKAG